MPATTLDYGPSAQPNAYNAIPYKLGPQAFTKVGGFEFTIGSESTNVITVSIQAKDARGRNLNRYAVIGVMFSTATFGEPDAVIDSISVTTGVPVDEAASNATYWMQTDGDGLVTFTVTSANAVDFYIRAFCGDVMVQASSQLDYT